LNVLFPVYKDIDEHQIAKGDGGVKFVKGTEKTVAHLTNYIELMLGTHVVGFQRTWRADFWYDGDVQALQNSPPPSDAMELAFNKVIDVYIKHQYTWDNADKIVTVDES